MTVRNISFSVCLLFRFQLYVGSFVLSSTLYMVVAIAGGVFLPECFKDKMFRCFVKLLLIAFVSHPRFIFFGGAGGSPPFRPRCSFILFSGFY